MKKTTNLSSYEFACGGVETQKIGSDKVELYREQAVYHVRRFADSVCGRRVQEYWQTFETPKTARRAYKRQLDIARAINKGGSK